MSEHTNERTETYACDSISRQKAIEAIDAVFPVDPMKSVYAQGIALGAALAKTYIEQLPSAQPEVIHCRECGHHHYEKDIPYCDRIDYGYGWKDNDFCSRAERRTDG